jgi:hypothetical protein
MSLFRKFIRVPAQHTDGTVKLQRVKISRRRTIPLAVAAFGLALTFLFLEKAEYLLPDEYKAVVQKARVRTEEKQRNSEQRDARNTKNSEGGLKASVGSPVARGTVVHSEDVFVPLYTRGRDPVLYKHTDKEWIEAAKLVDDPVRIKNLHKLIMDETMKVWAKDKKLKTAFLRVSCKGDKGRQLEGILHIVVPQLRPPTYEKVGIAFSADGVQIATRPLSNRNALRIYRILYPTVLSNSFWNAGKVFGQSSFQLMKKNIQDMGSSSSRAVIFSSSTAPRTPESFPAPSPGKASASAKAVPGAVTEGGDALMTYFQQLTKSVVPETPLALAKSTFIRTFATQQIGALHQVVPDGAVFFRGYVTFIGFRGRLRSTISATYLPGQDTLICPIIVERTEVLPDPHTWHSKGPLADSTWKPDSKNLDNPSPQKTKNYEESIQNFAKRLINDQAAFEKTIQVRNSMLEVRRQNLAKSIDMLENKMNGTASAEAKRVAAEKVVFTKERNVPKQVLKDDPELLSESVQKELEKDTTNDGEGDKAATSSIETTSEPGDRKKE